MNDEKLNFITLSPFKKCCMSIGQLPTSFVQSMSYYECLCYLENYLRTQVIPALNNNSEVAKELQERFIELQNYVNNYFSNLDVQEEINNKLDAMTEDGTLAQIINDQIFKDLNDKVDVANEFFNNKLNFGFINADGNCTVISGSKNIIIDVGGDNTAFNLLKYLNQNNITKIDYLIISHYHTDHTGGFNSQGLKTLLQSSIDFTKCQAILPHPLIDYNLFLGNGKIAIQKTETEVKQYLTTAGIPFNTPTENQIITIDENISNLEFFNCNPQNYDSYYQNTINSNNVNDGNTNYNNFSLIVKLSHYKNEMFITSDIEKLAESIYADIFSNCTLLQIPHHCSNYSADLNFSNQLNPKIAVICARENLTQLKTTHDDFYNLKNKGCKILTTANSNVIITSQSNGYTVNDSVSDIYNVNYNLYEGQAIKDIDLNDLTIPGIYRTVNATETSSCQNLPTTYGNNLTQPFKMIVEKITPVIFKQTIYPAGTTVTNMFSRIYQNNAWSPWRELRFTDYNHDDVEFLTNVTKGSASQNRLTKVNGTACLSLWITLNEEISAHTNFANIPENFNPIGNLSFPMIGRTNTVYQCWIRLNPSAEGGGYSIRCNQNIPNNEQLIGNISYTCNI